MNRERRLEAKRARRNVRLAARRPGSEAHIRALRRHRTLGGDPHRLGGRPLDMLTDEAQRALQREALRLLGQSRRLQTGADRMEALVAFVKAGCPQHG